MVCCVRLRGVEGFLWTLIHLSGAGPQQIFKDAVVSLKVTI